MKRDLAELAAQYRRLSQRERHLLPREQLVPAVFTLVLAAPYEPHYREEIGEL